MACYLATLIKFQSTLPREERPVRRYSLPLISVNFNPRSHERSDNIQNLTFALTKRFQSTLPREERLSFPCNISFHLIFQSTLPREERPQHYLIFKPYARISIHAPTRGATTTGGSSTLTRAISIHAPTRGATMHPHNYELDSIFQSTLPREERQIFLLTNL